MESDKYREGNIRIPAGCAISGIFSKNGKLIKGDLIEKSIAVMHDRSNGLGGGFAGYGIYPDFKNFYAFHVFFDSFEAKEAVYKYLLTKFYVIKDEPIPTEHIDEITNEPIIWRFFLSPNALVLQESKLDEKEFTARCVVEINHMEGAYVFSSGKNMGVFKAVGYPEEVARFYKLDTYEGYCWTAHGRYPTNTPGWWGGAHPFSLLDYSVVHNGEISSYDANRRFIEMFGYKCELKTDTEVITYIIDYLVRKQHLSFDEMAKVICAPFWSEIERMDEEDKKLCTYLRKIYSSLLVTGPMSILVGFEGGIMALNDRLKLRALTVGEKDDMVYFASEEAAIRVLEPNLDKVDTIKGGEPYIVTLNEGVEI